ncbi:branched-chain amino acid transporter permease [Mycolicibacterium parafortuitum]|uniref:Branched-chain amino acid permease [Sanguibacter keddieii DSM] n=1 Tax=Mycolicibacterium parafortuitum TaxID=39692 RepID=A0A375YNY2_MYCPF|nr:AzlD domain-containing protein [Mycolicibacterium parafortuitum]ORB25541.1 branched-chain amino acid ABC transporter [Mycolicibacterium parafortuitum]SRX82855.1 branched-chain amino acid permease [Sanguibacter keddieii DSM] [Mycolicibacterium parafortuitum]
MPDNGYIAVLVLVSAAVTWALRALPFVVLAPLRHSRVVRYLSVHMPVGVMAMLAVYTVPTVAGDTTRQLLWLVLAVAVTAGLHLWRASALLSILAGTTCYVTLMSVWG